MGRIPHTNRDQRNKSKAYFIVGYGFLMAMALLWSVDDSVVYIFLGVSIYFLFLGFYTNPSWKDFQEPFKTSRQKEYTETPPFAEGLKNIFQKKRHLQKRIRRLRQSQPLLMPTENSLQ